MTRPANLRCGKSRPPVRVPDGRGAYNRINWALPTGRVKFFNTDRGFGFILPDDGGPDVFVHVHDVEAAGMKMLVADQLVEYELGPARDGPLKGCQSSFALTSRPSSSRMPSWRASGVVRGVRRDNLARGIPARLEPVISTPERNS
jgi:cold shock protein